MTHDSPMPQTPAVAIQPASNSHTRSRALRLNAATGMLFAALITTEAAIAGEPPPLGASAATNAAYLHQHAASIPWTDALGVLSVVFLLWYVAALGTALRQRTGAASSAPTLTLVGCVATGILLLASGAVSHTLALRMLAPDDTLAVLSDLQTILITFALASMALCVGAASVAMARTGVVSRLLGWLGLPLIALFVAAGLGIAFPSGVLLPGGALWSGAIFAFVLWIFLTSLLLTARR